MFNHFNLKKDTKNPAGQFQAGQNLKLNEKKLTVLQFVLRLKK
jgi:hypothetical protein